MLLSEDGRFAYVTDEVGDLVYLVDALIGGDVVQSAQIGTRPLRFATTPDGGELRVSAELSGRARPNEVRRCRQDQVPAARSAQDRCEAGWHLVAKDARTAYGSGLYPDQRADVTPRAHSRPTDPLRGRAF